MGNNLYEMIFICLVADLAAATAYAGAPLVALLVTFALICVFAIPAVMFEKKDDPVDVHQLVKDYGINVFAAGITLFITNELILDHVFTGIQNPQLNARLGLFYAFFGGVVCAILVPKILTKIDSRKKTLDRN